MAYNNLIDRTGAESLIPVEYSKEIFQAAVSNSAVMTLGRRLPDMSTKTRRIPVLSQLAYAYFVNGDTGMKQTSQMAWKGKFLEAEEIAVIVPVPEAVLADSEFDIWASVRPSVVEGIGAVFDGAVLYGTNKPSSWPDAIVTGATNAGNVTEFNTYSDRYAVLLEEGGLIEQVELDGYMVTGHIGSMASRSWLRGIRDLTGQPIFLSSSIQGSTSYNLDGAPIMFPKNGVIDDTKARLISGDFSQLVWAVRQDITMKIFTEGAITDDDGKVIYNLMQQDMVALRVVFRAAWQLPNPVNRLNSNETTRYPFAILVKGEDPETDPGTNAMNVYVVNQTADVTGTGFGFDGDLTGEGDENPDETDETE